MLEIDWHAHILPLTAGSMRHSMRWVRCNFASIRPMKSTSALATLDIDYPHEGEAVGRKHYTIRVSSAEKLANVEISIDRKPWQSCRHACGHWWFDLSDFPAGEHALAARATALNGEILNSNLRRFSCR